MSLGKCPCSFFLPLHSGRHVGTEVRWASLLCLHDGCRWVSTTAMLPQQTWVYLSPEMLFPSAQYVLGPNTHLDPDLYGRTFVSFLLSFLGGSSAEFENWEGKGRLSLLLKPAATATPRSLSEMYNHGPNPNLIDNLHFNRFLRWFMCTLKFKMLQCTNYIFFFHLAVRCKGLPLFLVHGTL